MKTTVLAYKNSVTYEGTDEELERLLDITNAFGLVTDLVVIGEPGAFVKAPEQKGGE